MTNSPISKLVHSIHSLASSLSRTRKRRLVVSTLLPPVLGGELMLMAETIEIILKSELWRLPPLGFSLIVAGGSYVFMGLQSLISAFLMEYLIRPRANHEGVIIFTYCILGMLSGATLGFLGSFPVVMSTGLFTGLIVGLILATSFNADTQ